MIWKRYKSEQSNNMFVYDIILTIGKSFLELFDIYLSLVVNVR